MITILVIFAPLIALIVWAVVFDWRRRRAPMTSHDIGAAARRARAGAEGRSVAPPMPGYPDSPPG